MSFDRSASADKVDLSLTPYLIEPLRFFELPHAGKLSCMAIEQTGKSSVWKWGLLYSLTHNQQPSLIVYPSDTDASDTNQDSVEPLMRGIPQLAMELERPNSKRKDCYKFSNVSVYFCGGGADLISKPVGLAIADELDMWVQHLESVDNIQNIDKRGRTFPNFKRVAVCSPKGTKNSSLIYREFNAGSRGFYTLRCLGCGELTIKSCDISGVFSGGDRRGGLDFKRDSAERVVESSLTLVCPVCGKGHKEHQKREMIVEGGYIHEDESKLDKKHYHASYQWGALASQWQSLSWLVIAEAQIRASRSGEMKDQIYFDNSIRGMPFHQRKAIDRHENLIEAHTIVYPADLQRKIKAIYLAADTQDDCVYYVVRAFDTNNNSYLLDNKRVTTWTELEQGLNNTYLGLPVNMGIIDYGGHRQNEAAEMVKKVAKLVGYKGSALVNEKWKRSDTDQKLFLVNERSYKTELLYHLYSQTDKTKNYWYLPSDIKNSMDYSQHILNMQPPKGKRNDDYANWESISKKDHYFDCEKQCFVIKDLHERINQLKNPHRTERRKSKYERQD